VLKHFQERMPYCSCRTSREEPLAPGCVSQAEPSLRLVTSKRQKGSRDPVLPQEAGSSFLVGGWSQAQISKIGYPGARINFEVHLLPPPTLGECCHGGLTRRGIPARGRAERKE
jgi:hypothetical protein